MTALWRAGNDQLGASGDKQVEGPGQVMEPCLYSQRRALRGERIFTCVQLCYWLYHVSLKYQ